MRDITFSLADDLQPPIRDTSGVLVVDLHAGLARTWPDRCPDSMRALNIEALSCGLTLEPGDVVAIGTPEGVGLGRTPPVYLNDGNLVETEIEGIGMFRNRIHAC